MSVRKQFDQIKAEQESAAQRAAREVAFFQEHKSRLIQVIDEIGIVKHLQEVRRDFWKLGRITQSEFLTLPQAKTTAVRVITLEAKWDALNDTDPKKPYIYEEYRSLVVRITAYKSGTYIQVGNFKRFKYHGDSDIEKFEAHLLGIV